MFFKCEPMYDLIDQKLMAENTGLWTTEVR